MGVKLLLDNATEGLETESTKISQSINNKQVVSVFILYLTDAALTFLAIWLFIASPMARTPSASVVSGTLLVLGTVLSCLATTQHLRKEHS